MVEDQGPAFGACGACGPDGGGQPSVGQRRAVGSSLGCTLVGSSRTLRQVQERAHAVHALGAQRGVGAHLRRSGPRQEKPVSDDRLDHRTSTSASGHWPQKGGNEDPALGRSRGGLSTKIHLLADENGLPLQFRITPGQAGEYAPAADLLANQRAEAVIADRGYDADALVAQSESIGAAAVIPPANRSAPTTANYTSSATASNAASTNSNTSAASPHATAKPSRPSAPSPLSLVPGSDLSYMWIRPSSKNHDGARSQASVTS